MNESSGRSAGTDPEISAVFREGAVNRFQRKEERKRRGQGRGARSSPRSPLGKSLAWAARDPWRLRPREAGGARTRLVPGCGRAPAGGGGRGGGGCGRGGVSGGRGSHLCRAGAAAIATHTPRAPLGAGGSAGSELASARSPGQQRGRPAAACTAASAALRGPGRSEGESQSREPSGRAAEPQLREGACRAASCARAGEPPPLALRAGGQGAQVPAAPGMV